jgi:hypothetical protein
MARIFLIVALLPSFVLAQDNEFNFNNPSDYNNFIMKEVITTVQKNFEYISLTIHSEDYDQLEKKRKEVVDGIAAAKAHVREMPPLEGDTKLRDEAVDVLNEYKTAFELDFKSILNLKRKSKDSFEAMEAYFIAQDKAEEKVNKATRQLRKAQHVYAEKNNMKVVDSKSDDVLEKKMNKIIEVNDYWRSIFLTYFKVSKQYDKLWDALSEQKANPLNHQRDLTLKVIDQVLPELTRKSDFHGDSEFRDQTINMIEYYRQVAEVDFGKIIDVLSQKSMEHKDVEEVNSIITKCNADHDRLAYNWNIASQDLFRKNVDKE